MYAAEDLDLVRRAHLLGLRVLFAPDLYVFHPWNFTPGSYIRRAIAFKAEKKNLEAEKNRKYILIGSAILFLSLGYFLGFKVPAGLGLACVVMLYGYFVMKYLKWKLSLRVSMLCGLIRIAIATVGVLVYSNLLHGKKHWK
jgi:GT2 family glycosyltransferase